VIIDTPDCDDQLVFCHEEPDLPEAPETPTPDEAPPTPTPSPTPDG